MEYIAGILLLVAGVVVLFSLFVEDSEFSNRLAGAWEFLFVVGAPALVLGLVLDGLGYQSGVYVAIAILSAGLVLVTILPVISAFLDLAGWFTRRRRARP